MGHREGRRSQSRDVLHSSQQVSVLPGEGLCALKRELGARPSGEKEATNVEEDTFQAHGTVRKASGQYVGGVAESWFFPSNSVSVRG